MFNRQGWKRANLLRQFVVFSIATLVLLMSTAINGPSALGQLPSLTSPSGTQPLPVGVKRQGTLESAGVRLDGKELFRIASPIVLNRSELGSQIPVEIRAEYIEANLEKLITSNRFSDETVLDPKTLEVVIETINGQPVLFIKDATPTKAQVLLTVTEADAQYASISKERLAERWQEILERELRQALELRQPRALQRQISTVVKVLVTTVLLTLVLGATWVLFKRREQQLEQRLAAETALIHTQELTTVEPPQAESELRLFQGLLRQYLGLQQRLQIVLFLRWLLFWAIAFVWVIGIAYSLNVFPQTSQFAKRVVAIPIVMLMAWFLTGLANRLTDFGIDRFTQSWQQDKSLTKANLQRIATVANVIKGLKMVLVYTVAILWVLRWLHLAPDSILTLGALLALVVSFAVQSLVQDLVNGFLILLEDQFRIGDNIRIDSISGMVENLNLRVTQLRSDEGNLITLPNRLITQVENRSRSWARADFRVEVAYKTDVDRALAIVRKTVDQMAQDPEWQSVILDTHELFGVDQISHTGIVIRIWIKTAPLQQWATARELRRRLKIAFDRNNIQIGTPQNIQLENGSSKSGTIEHSKND
ncbi:MAG: mechanosensitive ion channel family protein [Chroococcidiopsidaceae cyanobacterium CP_BM_RX_35]|nr:mechanosensitive ion channel family protein [Chroococcidiopsidaceae cyanobacterium CP_BM_RX_35]